MKKIKIIIKPDNKIIYGQKGDNLGRLLKQNGININDWCNLKGICGQCIVEIIKGKIKEKVKTKIGYNKIKSRPANYTLACQVELISDLTINIPNETFMKEIKILERGLETKWPINPAVKEYIIKLDEREIKRVKSFQHYLKRKLKNKKLSINWQALQDLGEIVKKIKQENNQEKKISLIIYENKEILKIEENFKTKSLGLAIDLGTTTIVVEAVNLKTGEIIGKESDYNQQVKFGADILSRIALACSDKSKLKELKEVVIEGLNQLIKNLAERLKLMPEDFLEAVIAGNTTMNHLLLGLPVDSLAQAPFLSLFSSIAPLKAVEVGLKINPRGRIYLAPNIQGFVGGDISAGLLATNFFASTGPLAFIDLGTNGEIALKNNKHIIVTSTAAGPAFEGASLSCGLPAIPGAISRVKLVNGKKQIETINNLPAKGICGSGLVDLLAIFLQQGIIEPSGKIAQGKDKINLLENIFLTQEDIRQAQLACAAIKAGLKLLLRILNLKPHDLKALFLAGGFGQELSIENSQVIGLIPHLDLEKIFFVGNTSLAGASLLLLNQPSRKNLLSFLKRIKYISLANQEDFQTYFLEALRFEPWP
ncbi:MAG: ASKHA domain-containing protein [Candidatus Aminicenantes bacterium]|nr:ASKHA domain-containing protein [Candidatus Aminicenantes bacterium]